LQFQEQAMAGLFAALYGIGAYALFLISILYAIGFVGNFVVPKSIDSGLAGAFGQSMIIDIVLLGLFAVQHSVMARPAFKRWWTRFVPTSVERSTFVLFASTILLVLYWKWQPMPDRIWTVQNPAGAMVLQTISLLGWALVVVSTFMISHFELFGLKQVFARLFGSVLPTPEFHTPYLYKHVRHPIYLGFLLAFWATPIMTVGHLLFAIATTGYILIGIQLEERDLIHMFGDQYRRYRDQVGMLCRRPGAALRSQASRPRRWNTTPSDDPA
jgi:protein-S-isoprenylcysteine O-methyltransferase Ste14